jgi:hypothetical protein
MVWPFASWSVLLSRIVTRTPSSTNSRSLTSSATTSDLRNAPAKPSMSKARSRRPFRSRLIVGIVLGTATAELLTHLRLS